MAVNTGSTNIDVTAASINILAQEATQNSGGATGHVIDNLQRSQIGHGQHTVAEALFTNTLRGVLDVSLTEGYIAGNVTVLDDDATDGAGILLSSTITGTLTATNGDAMITRIGHGSQSYLNSHTGDNGANGTAGTTEIGENGFRGGDITVNQASILGSDISVTTSGVEGDNQDISIITNITAGLTAVEDNTAVAQIGHSGDIFAHTGNGGAGGIGDVFGGNSGISGISARAGDITINKGSIWDLIDDNGNIAATSITVNIFQPDHH